MSETRKKIKKVQGSGKKCLTFIKETDIFIMRGWDGNIPPRTIPGAKAPVFFLFFQLINI